MANVTVYGVRFPRTLHMRDAEGQSASYDFDRRVAMMNTPGGSTRADERSQFTESVTALRRSSPVGEALYEMVCLWERSEFTLPNGTVVRTCYEVAS